MHARNEDKKACSPAPYSRMEDQNMKDHAKKQNWQEPEHAHAAGENQDARLSQPHDATKSAVRDQISQNHNVGYAWMLD